MNCIIIDDEATARAIVARHCSLVSDLNVVEEFDNAIDAIKFLNRQAVDVIFLDIHMPGFSGVDFVQTLKNPPKIVLITSDTEFAIEAYEYEAIVDYLVKPLTLERFVKSMGKIKNATRKTTDRPDQGSEEKKHTHLDKAEDLYINIDKRLIKLHFNEILVIRANGDYIDVTTENKEYRVHTTLKKIKEKLPNQIFLQIHRSYVINISKIIDIEDNSVLIKKMVIPISRSNRPELMRRLNLV
ncbi:LytR/AlgR family response regulator transcription factor [Zobellia galactanivorans]|uniref:LytR/AlgR family response regulator transcription factor n=1 Tax=Zobellia galactanivorans (strain DSM 12802 / CCUG 47099 / CIP 106680 / NCIMB 13871 / Dsij) TaxID=63186 RepID=UPI001C074B21|nr:LytTR family DNA-binding domain-containing protein [Zobellia galactanivorans]MBU3025104.1 LytTR family DNA-binding domain-containing protein [Zobellia galactanivorans]